MTMPAQQEDARPEETGGNPKEPIELFGWLPCRLSLEVPVSGFTVGELLRLGTGAVVTTSLRRTEDIPLRVNGLLIAWIQFELIGDRLAARVTALA
jgi:flagellar motor switch/type III secretory pathway protein FliN